MTDEEKSVNTIAAAWGIIDAERDANKRLKAKIAELEAKLAQRVPMASSVEEAARDVAKCLNERGGHGLDLRHVAMLVHHAHQADAPAWNALVSDREYLRLFDEARHGSTGGFGFLRGIRACIAAYEAATPAQQAEAQEPCAWANFTTDGNIRIWSKKPESAAWSGLGLVPLFTRPQPSSEPMTDEQAVRCIEAAGFKVWTSAHFRLVKEVERHHGIGVVK